MRHLFGYSAIAGIIALVAYAAGDLCAEDWPMLACNPQRTGYTPEIVEFPYVFAWETSLEPDRVSLKCQVVVAAGRCFVGTKAGNLYALDARTGKILWIYPARGIIEHTAGVADGRVFVSCLDGTIHAVDAKTGTAAWSASFPESRGFSAAVLPADKAIFVGGRSGILYAVNQEDGTARWKADLGAPILQSAAFNNGRVYVGAENMLLRCLNAKNGEILWTSEKLYGQSLRQYYPVVTHDKVLVRVMTSEGGFTENGPFAWNVAGAMGEDWHQNAKAMLAKGEMPEEMMEEQERMAGILSEEKPQWQAFYVLEAATGKHAYVAPSWRGTNMGSGPGFPPVVDSNGLILVPVSGFEAGGRAGRFDLDTGRVVDIPYGTVMKSLTNLGRYATGGPKWTAHKPPWKDWNNAGMGAQDEKVDLSCGGPLVFYVQPYENHHAQATCIFDLRTRTWIDLKNTQIEFNPDPAQYADMRTAARAVREYHDPHLRDNVNTRNNAFSISGEMFFHNTYSRIHAWRGGSLVTDAEKALLMRDPEVKEGE